MKNYSLARLFILFLLFASVSCRISSEYAPIETNEVTFTEKDLLEIEEKFKSEGYDLGELSLTNSKSLRKEIDPLLRFIGLKYYKIIYNLPHPDGSGKEITCSAAMLVPIAKSGNYRIILSLAPTIPSNAEAPSSFFQQNLTYLKNDFRRYALLFALTFQAAHGFVMIIPDYPGYGSSYNQCTHPYLVADVLTNSSIKCLEASKAKLASLGYASKEEILVQGYSQGAIASALFTKEVERTNQFKIKLLATGGMPTDLFELMKNIKSKTTFYGPYFFPLLLKGFIDNKKMSYSVTDFLNKEYADKPILYDYPHEMETFLNPEFRTADLDTNPKYSELKTVFAKNSLTPWKNISPFVLFHALSDDLINYEFAKNYATKHNAVGKVTLVNLALSKNVFTSHGTAAIPFYAQCASIFEKNK